jgi:hypothetical protein
MNRGGLRIRTGMRCLDTRLLAHGVVMRRYRREADGFQFKTVEVPIEVWKGLNSQSWGKDRMGQWLRARERDSIRCKAIKMHSEGWKPLAIASELGVPCRTIHRWVKNGQQKV